jgi:hypothetical protein
LTRFTKGLIAGAAIVAVACIDMSAPKGPASISVLLLPSPSVVAGDIMRDSNGAPAPITMAAYDAGGSPIAGLTSQFFITDSIRYAHVNSTNELVGDSVGTVHVVGQIGSLQTAVTAIPVTSAPDTLFIQSKPDTLVAPVGVDSASSVGTAQLGVTLHSATQAPVAGFLVKYELVRAPAALPSATSPAVYIVGDDGKPSVTDTTDASGSAIRRLVVYTRALGDEQLLLGNKVDTAVVTARTWYKGVQVNGSPATFIVLIRVAQ